MKKKRTILVYSSLFLSSISIIALSISCSTTQNSQNSDEQAVKEYIKYLKPKLKPEKESVKSQTLASSITTESQVKEWFTGLPESNNGIDVKFISAGISPNDSTILAINYQLTKNDYSISFQFIESGFLKETTDENALSFKDFSQKNSFKIQLQTSDPRVGDPTNISVTAGTAWSWYYEKNNTANDLYDWYVMTNFHVVYKSVSYVKNISNSNPTQQIDYLSKNNVTEFDPNKYYLSLWNYDLSEKKYKTLLYTKNDNNWEQDQEKHQKVVTGDIIKEIKIITDYENKNMSLFSGYDQSKDKKLYNLDMSLIKITLDFSKHKDYVNKEYQKHNVVGTYQKDKNYFINNLFTPSLSTGVSIAGNPDSEHALCFAQVPTPFSLKYEGLSIGSAILNNLYGPFYWADKYEFDIKKQLSPGASGSAVYQLKTNDENQLISWNRTIPVGIYWGGQAVAGIGIPNDNNYWNTSLMPFIFNGQTETNQKVNYNVFDNFLNNLETFRK